MTKTANTNYSAIGSPGNTFDRRITADSDQFARNDADALGMALDDHDHSTGKGLAVNSIPSGGLNIAAGGLTVVGDSTNSQFNGHVTSLDGTGSASQPGTGAFRTLNGSSVAWRDHLNTTDITLGIDTSDHLVYVNSVTGAGISGSAGADTGNYLPININGTVFKIKLYAVS